MNEMDSRIKTSLAVVELTKNYDRFVALAPTTFSLHSGEIAILSGPNGSGKTTLLSCMSGLVRPSGGAVSVSGFDLDRDEVEVRRRLVYVPDVPRFYLELTAWEHLRFIALANQAHDNFEMHAEALLRTFGLWNARDLFPHHFSRGMQLKLGLAMAFIRPFSVMLLDEPTSALDVEGMEILAAELRRVREQGAAVLLSTHSPDFGNALADRHLIIRQGVLEV